MLAIIFSRQRRNQYQSINYDKSAYIHTGIVHYAAATMITITTLTMHICFTIERVRANSRGNSANGIRILTRQ